MASRLRTRHTARLRCVRALAALLVATALSPAPAHAFAQVTTGANALGSGRYFVGFTSQAQARAGGGVLDTVAIVRVDAGRVRVERVLDAAGLPVNTTAPQGLDPGYYRLFGRSLTAWPDLAMTPDGPSVGSSWVQAWRNTTGQRLDGAIDIDSVATARLLQAAGVSLRTSDGRRLTSIASIETELAVGLHRRVSGSEAAARAARLAEVEPALRALFARMPGTASLLQHLQPWLLAGRAWIYRTDATAQRTLVAGGRAGSIRGIPAHQARLRFNNLSGNRADAYLRITVRVRFPTPDTSVVTVRLHLDPALARETSAALRTRSDAQASSGVGELLQTVYSVGLAIHTYTVLVNGHHIVTHSAWYDGHPTVLVPVNLVVGADVTLTYTMTGRADIRHLTDGALPSTP